MTNDIQKEFSEELLQQAIDIAGQNAAKDFGGGPFGAIVVKDGKIVSSSGNSVTVDKDPTAHAEVNAIREACKVLGTHDLSGTVLYTSCEPCPMCLAAAYWAHIDKICFAADRHDAQNAGFSDEFIYEEFKLPLNKRSVPIVQIDLKDKIRPFETWKENEKKNLY